VGSESTQRAANEAGSTLVLFPTAVLILVGLGAVALDTATIFLGQRRLADIAAAVANDAVAGLDEASFYDPTREVRLDAERAAARRTQLVAPRVNEAPLSALACEVEVAGVRATVTCTAQVRPLFAPAWPGSPRERQVRATETAIGVER
jgi:Flp pilus assembly protein TadG